MGKGGSRAHHVLEVDTDMMGTLRFAHHVNLLAWVAGVSPR